MNKFTDWNNHLKVFFTRIIPLISMSLLADDMTSVLFIGSSYFNYNNLPSMVNNLVSNSDHEVLIETSIRNGLYLSDHASSDFTESMINQRDWDFVVLQGVGIVTAYPNIYPAVSLLQALEILEDKIHENCEATSIVFCMPWAFEDGMTWAEGWTDTYEDMQIHIYNNTLEYAEVVGFGIAPVGWAWYGALELMDYPLHYLHMADWNHPSQRGSYLMACTIYSTLFLETCVGNDFISDLDSQTAGLFQSIATDTVLNHIDLWNLSLNGSTAIDLIISPSTFTLEAYPNPFNPITAISYDLTEQSEILMTIHDVQGREVNTLLNSEYQSGHYEVEWNGNDDSGYQVSTGIYFCRLQVHGNSQTIKLVYLK